MGELYKHEEQKKINTALFVIAALVFAYTATRAYLLAITWDEAYTYIEFVRNRIILPKTFEIMSANNHLLNTSLMLFFTRMFGVSEIVMRIHILIAHLLFLFYSARLLKNLNNKWLIITAFIIVNVNPYMLDFFSVARGYGLSIGLMMVSIYYFYLLHKKEKKNTNAIISIIFAGLAALANFVLLNYCMVLFGLIVLLYVYTAVKSAKPGKQKTVTVIKGLAVPTLLMGLLLLFVVPIAMKLKTAGALFFGGERGFWADTMSTITDRCFYETSYNVWLQRLAKGFVFLILIASIIIVAGRVIKKQISANTLFLTSLLLLIGLCCFSTVVQHHLLKTPYLLDRTALFLVVLFNLILVFFISELALKKPAASWVSHIAAVAALFHFFTVFNFSYVLEWKLDCNTKEMLSDLAKIKQVPAAKETVSIGIPLIFDPAINFYREKDNLLWLNTAWREETTSMQQDYFFLSQDALQKINKDSITILKTYPVTGNVLAKPKYPPTEIKAAFVKEMNFDDKPEKRFTVDASVEYAPGFSYIVNDSITPGRTAVIDFNAEVMGPEAKKNNLVMVLSFQNAKGELYSWQKAYVKDFLKDRNHWFKATFTCIVPEKAQAGDEIKAYIWNPHQHLLYIKHMDFKWLDYNY
ncbi:MAG: hypothetical protein JWP12_2377 [Bacteroidetes bacterium]|nr:hypothetical protein [Bacteroidota bacterium]